MEDARVAVRELQATTEGEKATRTTATTVQAAFLRSENKSQVS